MFVERARVGDGQDQREQGKQDQQPFLFEALDEERGICRVDLYRLVCITWLISSPLIL